MPAADKAKLDGATHSATANTLARRDSAGRTAFSSVSLSDQPSQSGHAVPLGFLETALAGKYDTGKELSATENLNDLKDDEVYVQSMNVNTSLARNYPETYAGALWVKSNLSKGIVWQIYITYHREKTAFYWRTFYAGTWGAWKQVADKDYVDSAKAVNITTGSPMDNGGYAFSVGFGLAFPYELVLPRAAIIGETSSGGIAEIELGYRRTRSTKTNAILYAVVGIGNRGNISGDPNTGRVIIPGNYTKSEKSSSTSPKPPLAKVYDYSMNFAANMGPGRDSNRNVSNEIEPYYPHLIVMLDATSTTSFRYTTIRFPFLKWDYT